MYQQLKLYSISRQFGSELSSTSQHTGQMICLNNWQPARDSRGDNAPSVVAEGKLAIGYLIKSVMCCEDILSWQTFPVKQFLTDSFPITLCVHLLRVGLLPKIYNSISNCHDTELKRKELLFSVHCLLSANASCCPSSKPHVILMLITELVVLSLWQKAATNLCRDVGHRT